MIVGEVKYSYTAYSVQLCSEQEEMKVKWGDFFPRTSGDNII